MLRGDQEATFCTVLRFLRLPLLNNRPQNTNMCLKDPEFLTPGSIFCDYAVEQKFLCISTTECFFLQKLIEEIEK